MSRPGEEDFPPEVQELLSQLRASAEELKVRRRKLIASADDMTPAMFSRAMSQVQADHLSLQAEGKKLQQYIVDKDFAKDLESDLTEDEPEG